jgi:hypothetical protein
MRTTAVRIVPVLAERRAHGAAKPAVRQASLFTPAGRVVRSAPGRMPSAVDPAPTRRVDGTSGVGPRGGAPERRLAQAARTVLRYRPMNSSISRRRIRTRLGWGRAMIPSATSWVKFRHTVSWDIPK